MKRAAITLAVIVFVLFVTSWIVRKVQASGSKGKNQYRIAVVKRDLVKKTVTATGILTAWTTVDIKSRAGGRVDKLPVDAGTIIKKGDIIAEIDPSDTLLTYNSAKADIASNQARVQETVKGLEMQKTVSSISINTAKSNLIAATATANASKAHYASARSQSSVQKDLSEAEVENARATLAAEQQRLRQLTSASHPQQTAAAFAAYNQAQANLVNAEAQLKRQKALLEKGFVSQSQVDQAQATFDVATATVNSAKSVTGTILPNLDTDLKAEQARVRQAEAGLRTAKANMVQIDLKKQAADAALADYQQSISMIAQAKLKLQDAQNQKLNDYIKSTQVLQARATGERAKASMANAQIQLDQTHVTAPSDGIVLKKYVEQGTLITSGISFNSSGTSIVQMGDISRMYIDVQVDETDIASVDLDQKVDITFDAYATTPFEGKVIKIDPQAVVDSNVTTVHVRVEVDNTATSYRLLKPGMNASCEFISDKKEDVVSVPNEALKTDDQGERYVEIAEGGKAAPADKDTESDPNLLVEVKVKKTPVKVGLEGNDSSEITVGVKEGDRIITQTIEPSTTPAGGNPFGSSKGPGKK